jgi:hypothetical protein
MVVVMHAKKHDIKAKLQYTSNTFMAYLWDVPATAINQIQLINTTNVECCWDIILMLADPPLLVESSR